MMDSSKMSAAGLISVGNKAANLVSFVSFILWCIICSWIITFQDFYSCFRHAFQFFSHLILNFTWYCHSIDIESHDISISREKYPICEIDLNNIIREDVEIVMEKLGLLEGNRPQEPLEDSFEIANIFDGAEPSLDEVREAFCIIDKNNDGFIDAGELKKVMNSIGLSGISEEECRRTLMAFDDNGDERIDFGEFVKLMEGGCC